ncbi:MAG: hypothetical protein J0I24_00195 [Thiomonas arsenitoxydans]|uniref:DUF3617 family protein n=1 Tax=Thiomonas arsenitoxydans (strain DSM 22701 / CIP 110005 / 3As) TaxID=426114 RepID=A0A8I1SVM4_THIA3|nr:hypothetical protein [Thiomonas arsenitoxydans]MBN8742704.1 hypothetical protein [Thiomonas arsenitoxydans]
MNMRIRFVAVNLIFASALFSSCYAAAKRGAAENFIPAGKWEMSNGYSVCVPKGNSAPDPIRLAAEVASSSSTGDYRWVGECKILNYSAQAHGFSAKLACSQTSERHDVKNRFLVNIRGHLHGGEIYEISTLVPNAMSGPYSTIDTYHKVSDTCTLNPQETIVGPKTSIAQPLNPFLDVLTGLPEGTEANMP